MENVQQRRAQMRIEAADILAHARRREAMARAATHFVIGTLAYGLREQGLSDRAIADILGTTHNRVNDLVTTGIWRFDPTSIETPEINAFVDREMSTVYRPVAQPRQGWTHTLTDTSGRVATMNGVPIPREYRGSPDALDLDAAQFDNFATEERILVYSLERHLGSLLFDSEQRRSGETHQGHYRIDIVSPNGQRQSLLDHLSLTEADLRFGRKWPDPKDRRDHDDVFREAVAAVRRHYGIWPLPKLQPWDDQAPYWPPE